MRWLAQMALVNWLHIKDSPFSAISTVIICLCCLSALIISHDAMAGTLVVLPPGLEEVEGNSNGMRNTHLPDSVIIQSVWPASEFLDVPAGQNAIVAMNRRPDTPTCQHREIEMEWYELRLSTTDAVPGTLDPVFDRNPGDDEVVVYSGPLRWETNCSGAPGGPRDFDYSVNFQTPFVYDPSGGRSLLLEEYYLFAVGSAPPFADAQSLPGKGVRSHGAWPHTVSVAMAQGERALVRQFEFAPLPGDFDGDGLLTVVDVDVLTAESASGNHDPAFDLTGDSLVDEDDVDLWVRDLKRTWTGDADVNLAFDSSDMVQVFASGKYEKEEAAVWSHGDWNGDGFFNSSDMVKAFVDGGYEKGLRTGAAAVPEPTSFVMFLAGLLGLAACRQRRRHHMRQMCFE